MTAETIITSELHYKSRLIDVVWACKCAIHALRAKYMGAI
ncbi:MAG: hypothetical protein ACI93H_000217 [Psychromonas sp.]|jgi:hypothetical protein